MCLAQLATSKHISIIKVVQCIPHVFYGNLKLINVKLFVEIAPEEQWLAQFGDLASVFAACNHLLFDYFLLFFTQVIPHLRKMRKKFAINTILDMFHVNRTAVTFAFFIEEKATGNLQKEGMSSSLTKNPFNFFGRKMTARFLGGHLDKLRRRLLCQWPNFASGKYIKKR